MIWECVTLSASSIYHNRFDELLNKRNEIVTFDEDLLLQVSKTNFPCLYVLTRLFTLQLVTPECHFFQNTVNYEFIGLVEHYPGNMQNGHYIACVKKQAQWCMYSDACVGLYVLH